MKPATKLPWRKNRDNEILAGDINVAWGYHEDMGALLSKIRTKDAAYIVHACNAYPRLVAMMRGLASGTHETIEARALLRELGE